MHKKHEANYVERIGQDTHCEYCVRGYAALALGFDVHEVEAVK